MSYFWMLFSAELRKKNSKQPLLNCFGWRFFFGLGFFFRKREKHVLFKLKENLPFCLRVSADIWNSPGKKKKKSPWVLKTICTFCCLLKERTFLDQHVFIICFKIFGWEIWRNKKVFWSLVPPWSVFSDHSVGVVAPTWLKIHAPSLYW